MVNEKNSNEYLVICRHYDGIFFWDTVVADNQDSAFNIFYEHHLSDYRIEVARDKKIIAIIPEPLEAMTEIAIKYLSDVTTLETQKDFKLDWHDIHVSDIREVIYRAYAQRYVDGYAYANSLITSNV